MAELTVAPYAPALIESMRSVGYSLESAIADLIDNSISAGANNISIRFSPYDEPFVGILDNGAGMKPEDITKAMRHGGKSTWDVRAVSDLGRFGLGLKTASLSQCRKLTVVSLKEGGIAARCWDLDLIAERENWILYVPEPDEIELLPLVDELKKLRSGTLVLWQLLDRLEAGERSIGHAFGEKMNVVRDHLSLVFHRYLAGELGIDKIEIKLNENPLHPMDPFLTWHNAKQILHEESIVVENHIVKIKPYILPHISKLSPEELQLAGGEDGLRRNQGFYIYRHRRLIIWGTWFKLAKQGELSKLARVRVDIPNALDHLWTLDIKKSAAHPPEEVRQNLRRIVEKIIGTSRKVYTFRGRIQKSGKLVHSWNRVEGRNGISYVVNRDHPVIAAFIKKLDCESSKMLELLLDTIERTFPSDSLYADMASDRPQYYDEESLKDKFMDLAKCLLSAADSISGGRERMLKNLPTLDPFCQYADITESIVRELTDDI